MNSHIVVEFLAFLFLMFGECRGESTIGQLRVAQVVAERNMVMLDSQQFSCFTKTDIRRFERAKRDDLVLRQIAQELYEKLSSKQLYVWTMMYLSKEVLVLFNVSRRRYYMTHDALKHVRRKYPKWVGKLEVVEKIGGHVFLTDKKEGS